MTDNIKQLELEDYLSKDSKLSPNTFLIFTKDGCPYCVKAKELLKERDINFYEVNLNDEKKRFDFYEKLSVRTVPQIFNDVGSYIGGYDDLVEYLKTLDECKENDNNLVDDFINIDYVKKNSKVSPISSSPLFNFSKTIRPIHYTFAEEFYNRSLADHWTINEVKLVDDLLHFNNKLTNDERQFIKNILMLFTQSDQEVGCVYANYFIPTFRNNEICDVLLNIADREVVHKRAYSLLNETLNITDYTEFLKYPAMSSKMDFIQKAPSNSIKGVVLRLARSVFSEGVMLFSSFVMLLSFDAKGLMPGMCDVVRWSSVDEELHCKFLIRLFRQVIEEHPRILTKRLKSEIYQMAEEVYRLESQFIDLVFNNTNFEMILENGDVLTAEKTKKCIRYYINLRLQELGLKTIFKDALINPFAWFEKLIGSGSVVSTNFFERSVTEYENGQLQGDWKDISLDDFKV